MQVMSNFLENCYFKIVLHVKGDSGGALMQERYDGRKIQVGIVSYGGKCRVNSPHLGGYTDVRNFIEWIQMKTGIRPLY